MKTGFPKISIFCDLKPVDDKYFSNNSQGFKLGSYNLGAFYPLCNYPIPVNNTGNDALILFSATLSVWCSYNTATRRLTDGRFPIKKIYIRIYVYTHCRRKARLIACTELRELPVRIS